MQQQPRLPLWFLLVNWALIAGAFVLGMLVGNRNAAFLPEPQRTAFELVHREILQSHVLEHTPGELVELALVEMVDKLDPYSRYVPPSEAAAYDERNTGHYQGIGCEVRHTPAAAVLFWPMPGGPAEKAGIQPGDVLLAVDGRPLDTPDLRLRAAEFVRGPADTDVVLRVQRGERTHDLVVRRGDVTRPCVKWVHWLDREQGLAYLHLTDFHKTSSTQLFAALDELQKEAPLRGLVFDLRFDGGGNLDECIRIARAFVPSGRIVAQKQRGDHVTEVHDAIPAECRFPDLPMVVLLNERSASASEVLAGALQDHGRAAVVGVRSYGKGFVNTSYTWKNLDFRLRLTTGRYVTPNGRDIERHFGAAAAESTGGIPPDVEVPVDEAKLAAIQQALAASPVPPQYRAGAEAAAARHGLLVPLGPMPADDPQLQQALATLRERTAAKTK